MTSRYLLLFPLLTLLAACSRDEPAGLLPENERAPQFDRASEFLDLGGVFYGYMDLTDQAESLGEVLNEIARSAMAMAPDQTPPVPLDFVKALEASGFAGLEAIGMSSRVIDEDMFHNRSIFYFPEGPEGFFRFFGDTSLPFDALRFAPEGTDLSGSPGITRRSCGTPFSPWPTPSPVPSDGGYYPPRCRPPAPSWETVPSTT